MSDSPLVIADDGAVRTITINRPEKLNALNQAVIDALHEALGDLDTDESIRAAVLTGAGDKAFVAGADIGEIAGQTANGALAFGRHGQQLMRRIELSGKPVIAAINGFALGGGCELALACTLRIAGPQARLGLPEIKLGIMPGFGGTQRVARLAGRAIALDLALTGRMIDAETAERFGLVHRIEEDPLAAAQSLAGDLAASAPIAIRNIITAIAHGSETAIDAALDTEAQLFALCCATEDMKEGTTAFFEKRAAAFKGK